MNKADLLSILLEDSKNAARNADISVLVTALGETPLFSFVPEKQMVSASVIKIPIMLCALKAVQEGWYALSDALLVEDILDDSIAFESGPREATLEELITWMIIRSDNTSTNRLIDLLGMEAINDSIAVLGLTATSLQRKMLDFAAIEQGRNNYTSAADMLLCYKALYECGILDERLCALALSILRRQMDSRTGRRYIWEDVPMARKSGGLDYLSHDTGLILLENRPVYVGVFVQNAPDIGGDSKFIGRVFRNVYDYYVNLEA